MFDGENFLAYKKSMPKTKKTAKKTTSRSTARTTKSISKKTSPQANTARSTTPKLTPTIDRARSFFLIIILLVAAAGVFMLVPKQTHTSATTAALQHVVTYRGEDGKNALDLLKAHHQVAAQQFSIGAFVTSVDGISAPPNYFWAFSVNGKPSDVGADTYITKNSDTLSWRLEKIQ